MIKRTKIKQQVTIILIGFFIVMGIISMASKIAITSLEDNGHLLEEIVNNNNEKYLQLTIMSDAIRDRMLVVYDLTHTTDIFERDELATLSYSKVSSFIKARDHLIALGLNAYQLKQLDDQRQLLYKAQVILSTIIEQALYEEEIKGLGQIKEARTANNTVLESLLEMQKSQKKHSQLQLKKTDELADKTRSQLIFLAVFAFLASAIVVIFIIHRLIKQGSALNDALVELYEANANLESRVEKRTAELMEIRSENMRMTAELDVGQRIQQIILPKSDELSSNIHLDIATYMEPADEIGGDYYDVLQSGESTYIAIGDVTGHGLESGVVMLMTQAAIRTLVGSPDNSPEKVLSNVNQVIYGNVQRMESDKHLTLLLLKYSYENNRGLLELSGQHETIIIARKNGQVVEISTDELGFPIGLVEDIDDYLQLERSISLEAGDVLVLYTDGITEAADSGHRLFGSEQLKQVIQEQCQNDAATIQTSIIDAVKKHIGIQKLYDDLTLVVIKQRD